MSSLPLAALEFKSSMVTPNSETPELASLRKDLSGIKNAEMKEPIATKFEVSGDDRKKLLKNKRPVFETRIIHALSLLRKDGFIVNQKRANFKITKSGLNRLKNI